MKIAYFTDTFLPQINGVATSIANIARTLGKDGHEIIIFAPKIDGLARERLDAKNIKVIYLPTIPGEVYPEWKISVFNFPRVLKNLRQFNPDIIHTHTPLTVGVDGLLVAKVLKKPLVGSIHYYFVSNDYLKWVNNKLASKIVVRLSNWIYRYSCFFYSKCDLCLSPSRNLIEELKKSGYKKTVSYLPNPIFMNKSTLNSKKKQTLKKKYKLGKKVVLHFGRLSAEKNIDHLKKAFSILAKKQKDITLMIVGDGPATSDLKELVGSLNLNKKVVFTGFIANNELNSSGLIKVADLFATASTMETQSMSVLEAMSFGLPIVAVNAAGMTELVKDNGFLVDAGDIKAFALRINEILAKKSLAMNMQKASLEMAKNFSYTKVAKNLLILYEELITHKSKVKLTRKTNRYKALLKKYQRFIQL